MLNLDAHPPLRRMFRIARRRVAAGFVVAAAAFVLARPSWRSIAAGAPIALAGAAVRVWAAGHLEKGAGLTTSGPYRWLRHPLYAGSALLGVGFVTAAGSVSAGVLVLGYLAITTAAAVRLEEATLHDAFGEAHARYVAGAAGPSTRRFRLQRVRANREHHALLGLLGAVALLCARVWWTAP